MPKRLNLFKRLKIPKESSSSRLPVGSSANKVAVYVRLYARYLRVVAHHLRFVAAYNSLLLRKPTDLMQPMRVYVLPFGFMPAIINGNATFSATLRSLIDGNLVNHTDFMA